MRTKNFALSLAASFPFLSGEVLSAQYCGTVNGVQVWEELVPGNCQEAMKKMRLSQEHINTSRQGTRIQQNYGASSSKTIESAITSVGDYLQKGADERADAERAAREAMYAEDDEKKRLLIAELSKHIIADYPIARIKAVQCKDTQPGMGVFQRTNFGPDLDTPINQLYKLNLPSIYKDTKKIGKKKLISELNSNLKELQSLAYNAFQYGITISREVQFKQIQEGLQTPIDCHAGEANANVCQYISARYTADFLTTAIGVIEKCIK